MKVSTTYRWLITLGFGALIIVLSITPDHSRPDDSIFAWIIFNTATLVQKLMHIAMYAILAFLITWSIGSRTAVPVHSRVGALAAIILGVGLEVIQTVVPGRFGSLADMILNTIGVLLGLFAANRLLRSSSEESSGTP